MRESYFPMTIEVAVQVTDVDLHDNESVVLTHDAFAGCLWSEESGITTMTVFSDNNPVADTLQAIRCAQAQGITVLRVKEDTLNVGEITRRIGSPSREAVRKWTQDPSFPAPVEALGGERASHLWKWAEVVGWLWDVKGIDMDENLPDATTVAHINAHIHGVPDVQSNVLHAWITDEPATGTRTRQLRTTEVSWRLQVSPGEDAWKGLTSAH